MYYLAASEIKVLIFTVRLRVFFVNFSSSFYRLIFGYDFPSTHQPHTKYLPPLTLFTGTFCVGFPHNLSAPAIRLALFVYESQVFVTWSLLGIERTLGMRIRGGHYSSRLLSFGISTYFLGAINLQGKEKWASFLTFVLSELCQLYCKEINYAFKLISDRSYIITSVIQ